jgi:HD domain
VGRLPPAARRRPPDFALDAADDAAFAALGPRIAAYLYANFPALHGLGQHRPHFDPARGRTTDPVEHTVEVIAALDTSGLPPRDIAIVRAAAVFHDIGKMGNPFNVRHAVESAELCAPYLADFALSASERADAVSVVANHDTLGRLAQGRIGADEAAAAFGSRRIACLTARLTRADIRSIRGFSDAVLPSIGAAYGAVAEAFRHMEGNAADRE